MSSWHLQGEARQMRLGCTFGVQAGTHSLESGCSTHIALFGGQSASPASSTEIKDLKLELRVLKTSSLAPGDRLKHLRERSAGPCSSEALHKLQETKDFAHKGTRCKSLKHS